MSFYRGMTCENVTIKGDKGKPITAYVVRPSGPGPFPGVVLVHHLPGWSEFHIETAAQARVCRDPRTDRRWRFSLPALGRPFLHGRSYRTAARRNGRPRVQAEGDASGVVGTARAPTPGRRQSGVPNDARLRVHGATAPAAELTSPRGRVGRCGGEAHRFPMSLCRRRGLPRAQPPKRSAGV